MSFNSSDDDWLIILIMVLFLGVILSLSGYFFLSVLGLFGIEKQIWAFANIDMVISFFQELINWFILPVYILVVGIIGAFILYKTEWNSDEESSSTELTEEK